jgi:GH43 family beta-xylosidase
VTETQDRAQSRVEDYLNPVYPASCADPFVLKHRNEYWCYCTGWWHDGRCFGVLHSRDLVHWREFGGAMLPYDREATCYWAPEVWYENGRFLLYYSVGNEVHMQIRVAESAHPAGPFVDCGVRLTQEEFAIDPHVFLDDDGTRYLFYATDFLQHTHIGTGTVCDRMLDVYTLAGAPQPITRARYDWQVYDPQRASKGGVRWHTIEGPFVLKRKGRYYQMFSGGNWMNETYGATYASSTSVLGGDEWEQLTDGERVLPILRTLPGQVIGPGHNSAVRGPDNQQWFCIYHRWSETRDERVLAIDRLDWVGERLTVLGPSVTSQPAPLAATFTDYFDEPRTAALGPAWECHGGAWQCAGGVATQAQVTGDACARCRHTAEQFSAEVSLRFLNGAQTGVAGVTLLAENGGELSFALLPQLNQAVITLANPAAGQAVQTLATLALPAGFAPAAFHLLRVEVNGACLRLVLDERIIQWYGQTGLQPHSLALFTQDAAAAFAGFALTAGWEDLFTEQDVTPTALGWRTTGNEQAWWLAEQQLWFTGLHEPASVLTKQLPAAEYEAVINVKLAGEPQPGKHYGFQPALDAEGKGPLLTVEQNTVDAGWALRYTEGNVAHAFVLPANFDPTEYQQFRFRQQHGRLQLQLESQVLGEIATPRQPTQLGLYAYRVVAAYDMVRVTALA